MFARHVEGWPWSSTRSCSWTNAFASLRKCYWAAAATICCYADDPAVFIHETGGGGAVGEAPGLAQRWEICMTSNLLLNPDKTEVPSPSLPSSPPVSTPLFLSCLLSSPSFPICPLAGGSLLISLVLLQASSSCLLGVSLWFLET